MEDEHGSSMFIVHALIPRLRRSALGISFPCHVWRGLRLAIFSSSSFRRARMCPKLMRRRLELCQVVSSALLSRFVDPHTVVVSQVVREVPFVKVEPLACVMLPAALCECSIEPRPHSCIGLMHFAFSWSGELRLPLKNFPLFWYRDPFPRHLNQVSC